MTASSLDTATGTGHNPVAMYDAALARHVAGVPAALTAQLTDDSVPLGPPPGGAGPVPSTVDIATWCAAPSETDRALVDRCTGATLDVGCGPGRFTLAVAATGVPALGVDIAPAAVALVRARGGSALRRSVFGRLPGRGRWQHVLLADGNIGIGADPARLLRRCRELLAPGGTVLVEVGPPGSGSGIATLRLRDRECCSAPFRWSYLSVDTLADTAAAAGLHVRTQWAEAGRWFAELAG